MDGCSGTWWTHFLLRSQRLLLLFILWTLWATRSVVHKSTGLAVRLAQVEGSSPGGAP
jgi:hypothetical protein